MALALGALEAAAALCALAGVKVTGASLEALPLLLPCVCGLTVQSPQPQPPQPHLAGRAFLRVLLWVSPVRLRHPAAGAALLKKSCQDALPEPP